MWKKMKSICIFNFLFISLLSISGCGSNKGKKPEKFYSAEDYYSVEKYDVHTHINTYSLFFLENCKKENYRLLSLNVNDSGYLTIEEQQKMAIYQMKKFPGRFNYATSFSVDNWVEKGWESRVLGYLKNSFDQGAIAVKVWKNIGMSLRDKQGKFIMIDSPRLDTIIDFIAKNKITLIGHLGEPKNCWLPIDQMTVAGDKQYFKSQPQYHMFLHPEFPSYEDQVNARDHMLDKHPDVTFIGAHLGSLEWDVDEIARRLDKYPNMAVETAARVSHLQHQGVSNHKKVYDFFIKYQDRIMYGSDLEVDDKMDSLQAVQRAHERWFGHWKFFTSNETLTDPEVTGSYKGLHLPKEVVDKFYFKNAQKWIPGLKQE